MTRDSADQRGLAASGYAVAEVTCRRSSATFTRTLATTCPFYAEYLPESPLAQTDWRTTAQLTTLCVPFRTTEKLGEIRHDALLDPARQDDGF